jgi:antigen flippase
MQIKEDEDQNSHKSILKSTALMGGSNVLLILLGILRTKIIAVLIGPAGFGLMGIFQNLIELIKSITSLGINFSGVKEVASSSSDIIKVSKSILILKRWSISTGLVGTVLTILFSAQLSEYSFGNQLHYKEIIFLSINILISAISSVQLAILQGLQKMKELAKAGIFGSALATFLISILYFLLGTKAIIPGMLAISVSGLFFSWIFTRDIKVVKLNLSLLDTFQSGYTVIKLGFFITITGLLSNLALYIVRAIILKKSNLESVGAFQACWTISSLYLNVLLYPLIADFFPRLSKESNNSKLSIKLINEQLEITILLAAPFIISMILLSNIIVSILYSNSFLLATPILYWQISGTFFIIISWPLGVLFLARNKGSFSFISELFRLIIFLAIIFFGWDLLGISVLGISYLLSNFLTSIFIYFLTYKMINYNYSNINLKHILFFGLLIFLTHINLKITNNIFHILFGFSIILISFIYSYVILNKLFDIKKFLFGTYKSFRIKNQTPNP